ncbi:MarR family winged helix-turn-helix transcriptional regulator [Aneurinibacillus migulanus]|uniref:Transcriptional regulator n=1 Tax=Aneurinibacillus migulanus TaxID=47500 RepID=A0A0D1XXY3_ANEMI|nr:MarR family transcriptional regulator [Aneurinibacillus migulanus]KIV51937.1 transcriptional regulator [Aneurinibacillus migulanus]KON98058.1 transcriptional regulator [Aneurinibacillus migulanus]MED0891326.1 MarR family transcriptional regulator [Aneurinibacillus migulanus]MED1613985.1 MarR family transcriptional regulator [Aneurinibacillus migulanus]MED4728734.1 MarR family transcriptional regulator [Aneurinibacillus migulanus]
MLEDCVVFLIGKAHQRVYQISKAGLQRHGVTPVQYALLHLLWEKDGQPGAELGERLRLDSATITGLLDRLTHSELVERRPDSRDRRMNRIYITEKGRTLEKKLKKEMEDINRMILADFTQEEANVLKDMLSRLGLQ